MTVLVEVQQACDDDTIPESAVIESWIRYTVKEAGSLPATEVSLRIVDAEEIRTLNRDYRDKDTATNVLSYPAGPIDGMPGDAPVLLGDIVICASVVREEAAEQGKAVGDHWAHMLVHGTLHLLGFDHGTDTEASLMEALETRILAAHGLADPYKVHVQN